MNCIVFFFKDVIYLFIERREEREKKRERNINLLPLEHAQTGDRTHNPGMCPDWESSQWPFTLQDSTQPTEPHQSGRIKTAEHLLTLGRTR